MAGMFNKPRPLFAAIVILLLATPLVFGKTILFPFVVYRTYWFYVLLAALGSIWFWHGTIVMRQIWTNSVWRALVVFLGIKLLTDLAGLHPWASIFGNYERMMGWWLWLNLAVFALLLGVFVRERRDWERLFAAAFAVGVAVTAYGLLQRFGVVARIRDIDPRLFSTVGNPGFLAGYLLLTFWAGLLVVKQATGYGRVLAACACALLLVGLAFTGTRGAWLGLIAGGIISLGFYFISSRGINTSTTVPPLRGEGEGGVTLGSRVRWIVAAVLFCIITVPAVWWLTNSRMDVKADSPVSRLFTFSDSGASARLRLWRAGLQAVPARWLTGYGENNIRLALDPYISVKQAGERYDSTHNIFLDALLAHGIIGLAAWLWLLLISVRFWYRRRTEPVISSLMLGAVAAYAVQGVFLFDTLVVLLPLFLFFAYTLHHGQGDSSLAVSTLSPRYLRYARAGILLTLLVLLYGYARSWQALREVTAGYRVMQSAADAAAAAKHFDTGTTQAFFGYGSLAGIMRDGGRFLRPGDPVSHEYLKALSRAYTLTARFEGLTRGERESIMMK